MKVQIEYYTLDIPSKLGGVFLDVGCCDGLYTDSLYTHVNQVYAFEANRASYEALVKKYQSYDNIEVVHALVGNGYDQKPFFVHGKNKACSTVYKCDGVQDYADAVTLDTLSIDSMHIKDVSIVKIDTEGCEAEILSGCVDTLTRCRPILLIEVHDHMNPGHILYIRELLDSLGYTSTDIPIPAYLSMGQVGPFQGSDLYKRHFHILAKVSE